MCVALMWYVSVTNCQFATLVCYLHLADRTPTLVDGGHGIMIYFFLQFYLVGC